MLASLKRIPRATGFLVALAFAVVVGGCDSDNPTGPVNQQVAPPTNQQASATWNITVTTSSTSVDLNAGSSTLQVEVRARRAANNQLVPPGTTARLVTTAGTLTSPSGTAAEVPVTFDEGGVARATLVTGTLNAEGVIIVRAQIEQSFGSTRVQVIDITPEAFQISAVSPSVGPPSGGTPISIEGSGFLAPIRVTMNVLGQIIILEDARVSSSSRISASTPVINLPSGQNATASITVENAFDENGNPAATDTFPGAFTFTRSDSGATTLKVISLSPTFGPNEGGTQVSILGEGFGSQVQVYFSNGPLIEAQILSASPSRLEVVTPAATGPNAGNANSLVDVRVVDPVSGQESTINGAFQYGRGSGGALFISALSPGQDEYLGGTLVTIFGQGFEEPVAVSMGGAAQQIISVSGTQVVVRSARVNIGCSNQQGPVSLTNIETAEGTSGPNFVYVPIQPTLISITGGRGGAAGGNTIQINGVPRAFGQGFDAPVLVTVNGVPATNVSLLDGQTVSAQVPPFTGTFPTETCGNNGTRQLPVVVDVMVENINTTCNDTLADAYTYDPPDSDCMEALVANFRADDADGDPLTFVIDFQDTSTGGATGWQWNFSGGSPATSSERNPTGIDFGVGGPRNVTLTVSRGLVQNSITQEVRVGEVPPL